MPIDRYFYLTVYGLVKYLPTPIGDFLRFLVLKPFCRRLLTFWIHEGVTIHWPQNLSVGRGTAINEFVFINAFGGVSIGDNVGIGNGAKLFSAEHHFEKKEMPFLRQPIEPKAIVVGDDVYIGMNALVLGGVTIGKGAVIGAGSVVSKDVPEFAIVWGFPARVIGQR
jgi:acetyltransferase-like isoleucine patch superfamily enzyme